MVGTALAGKWVSLGHELKLGVREAGNEKARSWAAFAGKGASSRTFADAAAFGEIVFSCTLGTAALDALRAAGKENLRGKVLVDLEPSRFLERDAAKALHGRRRRLSRRADPAGV
jgi:hypothetical protein